MNVCMRIGPTCGCGGGQGCRGGDSSVAAVVRIIQNGVLVEHLGYMHVCMYVSNE